MDNLYFEAGDETQLVFDSEGSCAETPRGWDQDLPRFCMDFNVSAVESQPFCTRCAIQTTCTTLMSHMDDRSHNM